MKLPEFSSDEPLERLGELVAEMIMSEGLSPDEAESIRRMTASILASERQDVYRTLQGLTLAMACMGMHVTGQYLDAAKQAFYYEGRGLLQPEDEDNGDARIGLDSPDDT
jgi:hypothetical protein